MPTLNALYDSAELMGVIATVRTPPQFFLNRYFPTTKLFLTSNIVFDEVLEGLPVMAPFVSPLVQAKPQKRAGFQAKMFSPAYVKPKHFLRASDAITRLPGEPLMGIISPEARRDRLVVELLGVQKRQIEARWEWMAARAVIDGGVTVAGEDYPSVYVDFGRAGGNNIVVSGAGNIWSNAAAPIASQLEDWSTQLLETAGFAGTDIIMSPEAWKNFRNNTSLRQDADLRRGIVAVPDLQPRIAQESIREVGRYGEFNLFVYAGRFREQDGTISRGIAANQIIMTTPAGVEGVRAFGAIEDMDANLQATDIFAKSWREEDPSGEQLMSQSAPLMIPGRPNAVLKITTI